MRNGVSFNVVAGRHDRFWGKVADGVWEPETFAVFDRFVTRATTYLDVGAWEGPTLLYAAQRAKSACGFEPDPVAFAGLQQNVAANPQLTNVRIFNECIAATSGEVQFGSRSAGGDTMSSLLFSGAQTTWTVRAVRLEEFIAREKLAPPFFVKIDTEGGEYSIMPSLVSFIRKHRPTLYLSTHPGFLGSVVPGILGKLRAQLGLALALREFAFLYTVEGRRFSPWELLVKKRWRENASIIATDRRWSLVES